MEYAGEIIAAAGGVIVAILGLLIKNNIGKKGTIEGLVAQGLQLYQAMNENLISQLNDKEKEIEELRQKYIKEIQEIHEEMEVLKDNDQSK